MSVAGQRFRFGSGENSITRKFEMLKVTGHADLKHSQKNHFITWMLVSGNGNLWAKKPTGCGICDFSEGSIVRKAAERTTH